MTIRDSLAQVQRLCDDIRFTASNCNSDEYNRLMNKLAIDSWEFFYRHGPELMKMLDRHGAGDAERSAELTTAWMAGVERERGRAAEDAEDAARYRWIVRRPKSKIMIDSQWGEQRISFYTCDANDFIDSARERAARAGERG